MNTKKQNKKKKGFTLIELIIVIAIIAILAAIAIPNFLSIQRKSKVKADIASAKTIYDATSALVAQGELEPTSSVQKFTLTPGANGAKGNVTGGNPVSENTALTNYIQVIPESKSAPGTNFIIELSGDKENPEIKVELGSTVVYPNGTGIYSINESKSTSKAQQGTQSGDQTKKVEK